ncbi:DUF6250 domain-containing protein [Sphingomonas sp. SAFR-052]|uniref:DUF6250 domain-containing protein n=1 Tax=Sphingomonas sp. SAFR-052 TaxID=3436867 RepID=UPI003F81073A
MTNSVSRVDEPRGRPAWMALAVLVASCTHSADRSLVWRTEAESPQAKVRYLPGGVIDIDTPRGLTLWYPDRLDGPVRIAFDAMAVSAGGPNDQVSDLNAFWMATDPAAPDGSVFARPRDGRFEAYDTLTTYYVGIGGNRNTTTRMRRYTGRPGDRPLLPQHDRSDTLALLQANRWTRIALIADGGRIAVERDGRVLFKMNDTTPYRSGWFALRTTQSHLRIRRVTISRP